MKFKFHWGWAIAVVMLLFFFSLIFRLYLVSKFEVDLISKDYYHKELNYEKEIQKKRNTNLLAKKVNLSKTSNFILIEFPKEFKCFSISGTVQFYCAAKNDKDLLYKIKLDSNNVQKLNVSNFTEKHYAVKVDWSVDSVGYYQEFNLNL